MNKRISPNNENFFFGYYDLQPFSKSERLHLCHRTDFTDRLQCGSDKCDIGLISIENGKYEKLADTYAWNFQQGAMLQWNPGNPEEEIIYNSADENGYHGVIMNISTGRKRFLDRAAANVSKDGRYALSINFARLYNFRPGYGYAVHKDEFFHDNHPANDGVYLTDIQSGKSRLILSLEKLWDFTGKYFNSERKMVINHITFNPSAERFILLLRNFPTDKRPHKTAVITSDLNGENLFLLSDYGYFSHYCWINDSELIAYCDGKELNCCEGINNYVLRDMSYEGCVISSTCFPSDNHMSLSPCGRYILNDTYPNEKNEQGLYVYDKNTDKNITLGKFRAVKPSVIDIRCDLHPRWSGSGRLITFDSTHEGFRGIYMTYPEGL